MYIRKRMDFFFGLVVVLFCLSLFVQTFHIREGLVFGLSAADFPRGVLVVAVFLALVMMAQSLAKGRAPNGRSWAIKVNFAEFLVRWPFFAMVALYVVLLPHVNYIALTLLFLAGSMCFLGKRDPKSMLIYVCVACGVTGTLYCVFVIMMKMFLP
jgi:hypothetical protein